MSAFGFLGFVVASINAVVNVANNINDNNNNRNNNNNDNNNNQINTNVANSKNDQSSMSMAMTGRGIGIFDQLRKARDRVWSQMTGSDPNTNKEKVVMPANSTLDEKEIRRKAIEAEVLETMEKMYKEQKERKKSIEEDTTSGYPKEIIDMLG